MQRYSRPLLTPLQMLMQMGFSQTRAQKALAATGDKSVQLASDWLAARLNDPLLDKPVPREYVVYMRPSGPLSNQIYTFWQEVLETVGRNAAQNLMPHITLCSYFLVSDEHSTQLSELLVNAVSSVLSSTSLPLPLTLDRYTSPNYMGLFVTNACAAILQKIRWQFVQAASPLSSSLSSTPFDEDLHLTLAYSFSATQFPMLETLVKNIDCRAAATWEICLYSRETRFKGQDVFKTISSHEPEHPEELLLMAGDYLFVSKESWANRPKEGWVRGTSWLTGCSGLVHQSHLVRVPESDTWTLHKGLTITTDGKSVEVTDGVAVEETGVIESETTRSGFPAPYNSAVEGDHIERGPQVSSSHCSGLSSSLLNLLDHSEGSRRSTTAHSDASSCDRLHSRQASLDCGTPFDHQNQGKRLSSTTPTMPPTQSIDQMYPRITRPPPRSTSLPPLHNFPIEGPRMLYVMRHGERSDFCFGGDWVSACIDDDGKYSRANLNLQMQLPDRADSPSSFVKDGPLTRIGELQAQLVGEGFLAKRTPIHHVFVSPALRCVMTANNVLKALNIAHRLPLKIEPGLFEWLAWYQEGLPKFMSSEELTAAGFNIDTSYRPVMSIEMLKEIDTPEPCEHYYTRNGHITNALLANTQHQGGSVLLVAHGASLDTCTRQLVGGHPRNQQNMIALLKKVPYCAVAAVAESPSEGLWNLVEPPFRNPVHSTNQMYDWTICRQ